MTVYVTAEGDKLYFADHASLYDIGQVEVGVAFWQDYSNARDTYHENYSKMVELYRFKEVVNETNG